MSFSVDSTLLPRYVNLSTSLSGVPSRVEMSPVWLQHIYSVLCALTQRPMLAAARSKLCRSVFGLVRCICQYRYVIGVVGIGDCCCGVSSASFLRQFEAILFDFVNRCSKYVVQTNDKEVRGQRVPLQYSCCNVKVFCVSIR